MTAKIERAKASKVGTMMKRRLRARARPSSRKSRSPLGTPDSGADRVIFSAARVSAACALSLPVRQNAKRIAHSREVNATSPLYVVELHSIKVATGLIGTRSNTMWEDAPWRWYSTPPSGAGNAAPSSSWKIGCIR
ncbi:hypothetical protein BRAS3843_200007 [Bradyrhizobium sp. STM 3843]|nr:hypothetical protein BRAS3843_200007 [Bradyrhizobium sp. STM 3843]